MGQKGHTGGKKHLPSGAKSAPVLLAPNAMRWSKKHMVVGQKAHGVGQKAHGGGAKGTVLFAPVLLAPQRATTNITSWSSPSLLK